MVAPKRRTKHREDPREMAAWEEREEAKKAWQELEAQGRGIGTSQQEGEKEVRGRTTQFCQNMQTITEQIESLTQMLGEEGMAQGSSTTTKREKEFLETAIQTPPSQTKQTEEESTEEVSP